MNKPDGPGDGAPLALTVIWVAWLMAFVYAFVAFSSAPHEGAGFPDGLNKPAVYLGWQGVAGIFALAIVGLSRAWPKGSPVRRSGLLPLFLAALHIVAIIGVAIWADF